MLLWYIAPNFRSGLISFILLRLYELSGFFRVHINPDDIQANQALENLLQHL